MESAQIKEVVKKTYTNVIKQETGCCSSDCCSGEDISDERYAAIEGYVPEADYGLGCGIPTEFAGIKEADTVLDLGSGAGNDVFIASKVVGDNGTVIGLDMTEAMVNKANENKKKLGFKNVEFILGDIENIPLKEKSVDVVLSNCVLNLVPDKQRAFDEIYRVLKAGGHFTISDITLSGELPAGIKQAAELYAGCVSGALDKEVYISKIRNAGFTNVTVYKEKKIDVPDSIMLKYISEEELKSYRKSGAGVVSITIGAVK